MRRTLLVAALAAVWGIPVTTQVRIPHESPGQGTTRPAFESVVIQESRLTRQEAGRSVATIDASGCLRVTFASVAQLIAPAYNVRPQQIVGGPDWVRSERFNIVAISPPSFMPGQARAMLPAKVVDAAQANAGPSRHQHPGHRHCSLATRLVGRRRAHAGSRVAAHVRARKSGPTSTRLRCDHRFGFCSCFRSWACSASRVR